MLSRHDPLASASIVSLFSRLDGPAPARPVSRSVYQPEQTAINRPHRLRARTINLSTCWITIANRTTRVLATPTTREEGKSRAEQRTRCIIVSKFRQREEYIKNMIEENIQHLHRERRYYLNNKRNVFDMVKMYFDRYQYIILVSNIYIFITRAFFSNEKITFR